MSIAELQVQTQNIMSTLRYLSKRVDKINPPNQDVPGEQDFLKKGEADNLYLSIQSATNDYLSKADAQKDYLTIEEAKQSYLSEKKAKTLFPELDIQNSVIVWLKKHPIVMR